MRGGHVAEADTRLTTEAVAPWLAAGESPATLPMPFSVEALLKAVETAVARP